MMSSNPAADKAITVVALSHESLRSGGGSAWHTELAVMKAASAPAIEPKNAVRRPRNRREVWPCTGGTLSLQGISSQLPTSGVVRAATTVLSVRFGELGAKNVAEGLLFFGKFFVSCAEGLPKR